MMTPRRNRPDRRGAAMLEAAVVYPVTMLLLIGTVVLGIAVFRYEQLQSLARDGARYASLHGPAYASDQNSSYATLAASAVIELYADPDGTRSEWLDLLGDVEPEPSDHGCPFHGHGTAIVLVGPRSVLQ